MDTECLTMKPCMERKYSMVESSMSSVEILMMPSNKRDGADGMSSNDSVGLMSETAVSQHPHRCSQV
jgi:hypothetical protein